MYDIIIIGAGIAGMTAGIYASRAGKTVLILEGKMHGGQIINTSVIENWPGDYGVSGPDLMNKVYNQAIELGVKIEYEEVLEITRKPEYATTEDAADEIRQLWSIKTDDGDYSAKAVIIATGTEPRKLSKKQAEEAGERPISYCATCDGAFYKGKPVVVIGSGNTAKHEIKYLEGIASEVLHIHHDDPIPEQAEAIFVAIGRIPTTAVFKNLVDLDANGYIVAKEDCKTSTPGLFVAGDCRTKTIRQLITAAADGATAAEAAIDFLA